MPRIEPLMSAEDYFKDPSLSRSDLLQLSNSFLHYQASKLVPHETSEAMDVGSALHDLVLTPHVFNKKYIQKPSYDRRTKQGKIDYEKFLEDNPGKILLSGDDFLNVTNMAQVLYENPQSARLLENCIKEVAVFWIDPVTNLPCKLRADAINTEHKYILDIKTTKNASKKEFSRSIFNLRYDIQAAFYLAGMNSDGLDAYTNFVFIAVENVYPYGVAFYELSNKAINNAMIEIRELLNYYLTCNSGQSLNLGYDYDIQEIDLPAFMNRKAA